MPDNWLLLPVLLNLILVFVVQMVMYRQRVTLMKRERIHPQQVATRHALRNRLQDVAPASDNFENQFEVPVIFYLAITLFMITGWGGWGDFYLALSFVLMRSIHAFIHITYNKVIHRFYAYIVSTWLLWALVASLMISWVNKSGII